MLKIAQIKVPFHEKINVNHIAKKLKCSPNDILSYSIDRKSLDARHGAELHYSYTIYANVKNEAHFLKKKDVYQEEKEQYHLPQPISSSIRPIIVGFGPAGMFAGLILAECGVRPIIIERGKNIDARQEDVNRFFQYGDLEPESNVQYGEGGAGTFSDGKLTSRGKSVRIGKVLEEFVEAGSDPSILYDHRPHIGTDVLHEVVKNMRNKIISLGGEIHFETRLESLIIKEHRTAGIHTNHNDYESPCVLLCTGHSAVDTYEALLNQGITIVQKDFAAGVRVEHPQKLINDNTYGKYAEEPGLPAASYQLTAKTANGRGVYSFCMCPGGIVIPASTVSHTLVVNGMSYHARDGRNANSAILVQIPHTDFDHGHPLDGFAFQKALEEKAYRDMFSAPVENIRNYVDHSTLSSLVISSSYPLSTHIEDMHSLFSEKVNASLEQAYVKFDRDIPGFISQGIMIGMESRSSSPIRILRNADGQSENLNGLYPCGEGAGYAGGIVSSAVDGIRQAENVLHSINSKNI